MKTFPSPQAFVLAAALVAPALFAQETLTKIADRPVDFAKDKNLYVVGYSHLDTQWRWTYEMVVRDFIPNTMRQNFPLLDKYPDYVFNFTGSRRYEFMKEYYPADYAKVKQYVAAGRWFPAGSSVDEGDGLVPSFESFQRHHLYGNRFFRREFGVASDEFMLPDCFGFPAALPSILAHAGIKGFSTQKLTWGSPIGSPFKVGVWEGPDGHSVVAALDALNYAGQVTENLSNSPRWIKRIDGTGAKTGVFADYYYYGTGDRGGAPQAASIEWIEKSIHSNGPVRVISARADRLFNDLAPEQTAKLQRYKGELLLTQHSAGSLTSQSYMKRWNRKNELLANSAERAAAFADWLGVQPYPGDRLYQAWDLVLGSQMHDILPGTSLPKAYEYSWNDEVLALNQFAGVLTSSSASIIAHLDTRTQGVPLVVYNPLDSGREDPVEASVTFPGAAPTDITVFDTAGQPVPTQVLSRDGNTARLLFLARVGPLSYSTFDIRAVASATPSTLRVNDHAIENARYVVVLNADGDIASIRDKAAGNKELLAAPARLDLQTEYPRETPAWNMDWSDRQRPPRSQVGGPIRVRVLENGPVRATLGVTRENEGSVYTQQIRLNAGSAGDRVEVLNKIDWNTPASSLRASFPLTVANPEAAYDAPLGVVMRTNNNPDRYEVPTQQWMDLTDKSGAYGVAILNDSKFAADKPDDRTLRLTLLYTPGIRGGRFQDQKTQDFGRHEILYALAGHPGNWTKADVVWQAARLNEPLVGFFTPAHPGVLGRALSLAKTSTDRVQFIAVKKAEDSDEIIVRVRELTGQPAQRVSVTFAAPVLAAREVDGQERPRGPAETVNGALTFDLGGFGVRAFAVKLAAPPAGLASTQSQPVPLPYDVDAASHDSRRTDGDFDGAGDTYPAELLPATLVSRGVSFQLGSTADGAKNALAARGQVIDLPAGNFNRVHLLLAAEGDQPATLRIDGGAPQAFTAQNWNGFVGQWDNRLWDKPIKEISYWVDSTQVGLVPGYIKPANVAWFATHYHTPKDNTYYQFSYLYHQAFALPSGARRITLPDNPRIRVFAISVTREPGAGVAAAAPLYDTLSDHKTGGAPRIPQDGQTYTDATTITLDAPLYYRPGDLHYTLDGSEPAQTSPVYTGPFVLAKTVTLKVVQFFADGSHGPVTTGKITVNDRTPPSLRKAIVNAQSDRIQLTLSEPVLPATATRPAAYRLAPDVAIKSATLSPDGREVSLVLAAPLSDTIAYLLQVSGLADTAEPANILGTARIPVQPVGIVYAGDPLKLSDDRAVVKVPNLPGKKRDAWTLNMLVKPATDTPDKTLIAGFGSPYQIGGSNIGATHSEGEGRYFGKFKDGIRFWTSGRDFPTNSPLETGRWQMLTATYDGKTLSVYKDGEPIGAKEMSLEDDELAEVHFGPLDPWNNTRLFDGRLRAFTIRRQALDAAAVKKLWEETKSQAN